jgi:chemotaxis protein methyltransferase CheR
VLREPKLFTELLGYLTVQVSDMFRDPGYFKALRDKVVPYLRTYPSIKVWVAGCATGEEAYSLAIMLAEEGLLERTLIYATDINPDCLRAAEDGVYDVDRFARFSMNYLEAGGRASLSDYYSAGYASAVLDRSLKKSILFSDHSLATDTAFAEVQLISCRNVLIYFERELQDRAIGVLCDSLVRRGFLGLGMKETLRFSTHGSAFGELSAEERIYQKL